MKKKRADYMVLAGRVLLVLGFLAGGFLKFRYLTGTAASGALAAGLVGITPD